MFCNIESLISGCLVEYIPSGMIKDVIGQIVNDPTVTDEQMMTALIRMTTWVGWPNATMAHLWVVNFFSQLENLSKYSMLIEVTLRSVKNVRIFFIFIFRSQI